MAQIKGKYVQNSTLDGTKIKLKNSDALKGQKSDGTELEIIKINAQDKLEMSDAPLVSQDPTLEGQLSRKGYVDAQRELAKAHADAKDAAQTLALAAETSARQGNDSMLDAKIVQESQFRIADVSSLDARLDVLEADPTTKSYVDVGDQAAKDYADQKIADLVNGAPAMLDTLKEIADAIATGETVTDGLLTAIGQVDEKVDQEILNRQSADQVLDDKIDQEITDRQAADAALDSRLDVLEADPVTKTYVDTADAALDGRLDNVEENLSTQVTQLFENNAAVYADANPGVADASYRKGWYFRNIKTGVKVNWYFFDGSIESSTLGTFSAYAVVTMDNVTSTPHLAVYTKPTGSGDAAAWYKSRKVYVPTGTIVAGKKYLMYFGQDPKVHPELPRLQMVDSGSSAGPRDSSEPVLTAVLGSNSAAAAFNVAFVCESLGVNDPVIKRKLELCIRQATKTELDDEVTARASGDAVEAAQRQAAIDNLTLVINQEVANRQAAISDEASARAAADTSLSADISDEVARATAAEEALDAKIDQEIFDRSEAVTVEQVRAVAEEQRIEAKIDSEILDRQSGDSALQSQLDTEKSRIDAILLASDADKDSFAEIVQLINSVDTDNDSAFASYVLSNNAALAQEVTDRQAGDSALDVRLDVLEADPVTKSYVDSKSTETVGQIQTEYSPMVFYSNFANKQITSSGNYTKTDGATVGLVYSNRWEWLQHFKNRADGWKFTNEMKPWVQSVKDTSPTNSWTAGELQASSIRFRNSSGIMGGFSANTGGLVADSAISMNSKKITSLAAPTAGADAVNKDYVDQGSATLLTQINNEVSARQAADSGLQAQIDALDSGSSAAVEAEVAARIAGDQALQTSLDTEIAAREAADVALDARIDAIEAAPIFGKKEFKTLTSSDLGYVDCAVEALADTMIVSVSGVMHYETESYTISVVGGKTRVTFIGDLAAGGAAELAAGDKVLFQYLTHAAPSSGGGDTGGGGSPSGLLTSYTLQDNPDNSAVSILSLFGSFDVAVATLTLEWLGWDGNGNFLMYSGPFPGTNIWMVGKPAPEAPNDVMLYRVKVTQDGVDSDWINFETTRL